MAKMSEGVRFDSEFDCHLADVHYDDVDSGDTWTLISIGLSFSYNIPFFPVVCVDLRQVKIVKMNGTGESETFDAFIRCDSSLELMYPCSVIHKKTFNVPVNYKYQ